MVMGSTGNRLRRLMTPIEPRVYWLVGVWQEG